MLAHEEIIKHYKSYKVPELSYATAADFCDSHKNFPEICQLNGDLKNVQRPWMIKAIIGKVPQGKRLLEIGAGHPYVANILNELGYEVTIVDPYDGSGNGPTEYELYTKQYPNLKILRRRFSDSLEELEPSSFDCIYSISVLEHIHDEDLDKAIKGIGKYLKPNAVTIHDLDHVLKGEGSKWHEIHLKSILKTLSISYKLDEFIAKINEDVETFFMSVEGHLLWMGNTSYKDFPFRRVVSIRIAKNLPG
jgi:SAM-dependent methyltransferase